MSESSTGSGDVESISSFSTSSISPPGTPSDEQGAGVGLSSPQLSHSRRHMLDLVNRLHSTGVQVDIDLPQIAVIGAQSAGKSSLIESISGITLPRAAGTCTRCPTECRLSRSDEPWNCKVFLRTLEDGKVKNEQFGDVIKDKSLVEERIRRAQRAILNPKIRKSKGLKYYLTDDDETMQVTFSTDYVSLQISGPDVADLSFVDLPGLIAGVGMSGNTNDIELVKNLVSSYIKRPSTIILLTVACETDFQNQGAQELAKAHDLEGKRTIGVLTKPDRIPMGEESNWIGFIRNEKEPLENGWFCVKQPASTDLKAGITWAEARQREDAFFNLTAPWSELDSTYQKYLRTGNLVERLSAILSDLISKRLPQIQEELERAIQTTRDLIHRLPKAPSSDPSNEIAALLHNFARDLARHVEGVPDENGLLQAIRPRQERFRSAVKATAPDFLPFEKRLAGTKTLEKPAFLSSEESEVYFPDDFDDGGSSSDFNFRPRTLPGSTSSNLLAGRIHIDEVFQRASHARTRELPGNYPFVVQQTYIKAIIKKWNEPAHILCRAVYNTMTIQLANLVTLHFSSFGQGQLEQRVKVLLLDHLKKCMERTEQRIDWLLELEDCPFTLNTHYLSDYKDKFLAYYKGAREMDRNATFMNALKDYAPPVHRPGYAPASPTGVTKVLSGLVEAGIGAIKPEELAKLIPSDGMDPALIIMADVRAYFQVAYKRFADNIPLAIDHELIRGVERNALQTLYTGLGITGPKGQRIAKDLAQENPSVASRREELTKKLERMQIASEELLKVY